VTGGFPHRSDRISAGLQWTGIFAYALTAFGMCHDGTSAGEFVWLLVVGAVLLPFLALADWIARGKPQVDADVRRD
jgi:hypothetical protein